MHNVCRPSSLHRLPLVWFVDTRDRYGRWLAHIFAPNFKIFSEFFVGEAVKSAMLSFSSANQDLAQAIVARIPDVAPDNLRSRLVAILN
eukprot:m.72744 g.72744  ORF g.72744 m.72744 type:complete len:89 (+) comp8799_c0_seq2:55-321(+)